MPKRVPPPRSSVPSKRPPSSVTARKPPSTVQSLRSKQESPAAPAVLFIDDEETIVATWSEILKRRGMQIGVACSADEAVAQLRERAWDVVVTDLRLGQSDGVSILGEISRLAPGTISIVLTGFPTLNSAVAAIRAGVDDYLIKPCKVEDMISAIRRGLAKREAIQAEALAKRASLQEVKRLAQENLKLKAELSRRKK